MANPNPEVQILFREKASPRPTQCGPDRPIIGAVITEEEAFSLEQAHPGIGFHWQTIRISGRPLTRESENVWIAVGTTFDPEGYREDPSPDLAFSSAREARHWLRDHRGYVLWQIKLGHIDPSAPAWPAVVSPTETSHGA